MQVEDIIGSYLILVQNQGKIFTNEFYFVQNVNRIYLSLDTCKEIYTSKLTHYFIITKFTHHKLYIKTSQMSMSIPQSMWSYHYPKPKKVTP